MTAYCVFGGVGAAQNNAAAKQQACDQEVAAFLPAQQTYQLAIDKASLCFAKAVRTIVLTNTQGTGAAELARLVSLSQAQAQLTVDGNAVTATMVATVSAAVSAYGVAEGPPARRCSLAC